MLKDGRDWDGRKNFQKIKKEIIIEHVLEHSCDSSKLISNEKQLNPDNACPTTIRKVFREFDMIAKRAFSTKMLFKHHMTERCNFALNKSEYDLKNGEK